MDHSRFQKTIVSLPARLTLQLIIRFVELKNTAAFKNSTEAIYLHLRIK